MRSSSAGTVASAMQPSTAVNLVKSGADIRLIAPQIWSGNSWLVKKDAPYKSLGDLKGKKIGNFARVTGAYFFSAVIAKERKLDIEKDFQNVPAETGALIALAGARRSRSDQHVRAAHDAARDVRQISRAFSTSTSSSNRSSARLR